jgi:hypothetical protein
MSDETYVPFQDASPARTRAQRITFELSICMLETQAQGLLAALKTHPDTKDITWNTPTIRLDEDSDDPEARVVYLDGVINEDFPENERTDVEDGALADVYTALKAYGLAESDIFTSSVSSEPIGR